MSIIERDKHSGHTTTGHEWDGIKELNTPVPKLVILCLIGAFLFSVGYWYLMPSWPLVDRFLPGKLGIDERAALTDEIARAEVLKKDLWTDKLESTDFGDIVYDDQLMAKVQTSGARLFEDNCAMCHGRNGIGNLNYPSLADEVWLWGNDPEFVAETLRVGINSEHAKTRVAMMPAFGSMGVLDKESIKDVIAFVRDNARLPPSLEANTLEAGTKTRLKAGAEIYKTVCAACHGQDLKGNQAIGAPNLTDRHWIYGNQTAQMIESVWSGRQGHMPSWESRLAPYQRKILALYVTTLDN